MSETFFLMEEDFKGDVGWELIRWCMLQGASEFTFWTLDWKPSYVPQLLNNFRPYLKTKQLRAVYTSHLQTVFSLVDLWTLNDSSIKVLKEYLYDGIFTYALMDPVTVDEINVYRNEKLFIALINNESEGLIILSAEEKAQLDKLNMKVRSKGNLIKYTPEFT